VIIAEVGERNLDMIGIAIDPHKSSITATGIDASGNQLAVWRFVSTRAPAVTFAGGIKCPRTDWHARESKRSVD
jgi:hypothetical protein